jgi:putative phage-type endonuclease
MPKSFGLVKDIYSNMESKIKNYNKTSRKQKIETKDEEIIKDINTMGNLIKYETNSNIEPIPEPIPEPILEPITAPKLDVELIKQIESLQVFEKICVSNILNDIPINIDTITEHFRYDSNYYYYNFDLIENQNPNSDCIWNTDKLHFYTHLEINSVFSPDLYRQSHASMRERLIELMNHIFAPQKSAEWLKERLEVITATGISTILGVNHFEHDIRNFYLEKCGIGKKLFYNKAMRFGNKYEDAAIQVYSDTNNIEVHEFGMVRHPEHRFFGASPDGITENNVMLEIKCVSGREITGIPPLHYYLQMQLQLECCGFERVDFEECKFIEYKSGKDYDADKHETELKFTKDGRYKGIIFSAIYGNDLNKEKHIYAPLGMTYEESVPWKRECFDTLHDVDSEWRSPKIAYWYLDHVSCVPVFRDRKLFEHYLPRCRAEWEIVEQYKKNGIEDLVATMELEKASKPQRTYTRKQTIPTQYEKSDFSNDIDLLADDMDAMCIRKKKKKKKRNV